MRGMELSFPRTRESIPYLTSIFSSFTSPPKKELI